MEQPFFHKGMWVCPICGYRDFDKGVIENHIFMEHKKEKKIEYTPAILTKEKEIKQEEKRKEEVKHQSQQKQQPKPVKKTKISIPKAIPKKQKSKNFGKKNIAKCKNKAENILGIANPEFIPLREKEVVAVLKNGKIIEGVFTMEGQYWLTIKDAKIKGTKYIAKTKYIVLNKNAIEMIHLPPSELKEIQQ